MKFLLDNEALDMASSNREFISLRALRRLYHFLGSVYFAIVLIVSVALFVVVGTFLESWTESHRFASHFTYSNPVFNVLLWLFFVNILISALRRWPFKVKHIPFLITHLGLLMILGGCLIKGYYGLQGTMVVLEGAAAQHVSIADTYVVRVDRRDPLVLSGQVRSVRHYLVRRDWSGAFISHLNETVGGQAPFADLDLSMLAYGPHSKREATTWIKDGHAVIAGLRPFPVHTWQGGDAALPVGTQAVVHSGGEPWLFYALHGDDVEPLKQRVRDEVARLQQPAIAILQDDHGDEHLIAVSKTGQMCSEVFHPQALHSVVAYAGGFGGYAVEAVMTLPDHEPIHLECPLRMQITGKQPEKKLEDNLPHLTLAVVAAGEREVVPLAYDAHASELKQPALHGHYLLRFQPEEREIPYRVRLKDARQIRYPNSSQPYSFEGDLIITDTRDNTVAEKTISMNNVHETWDGYRFYLASIAPGEEIAPQQVQLVVNRDPAKYFLTYPGAVIVALGIVLLFWLRRKSD